MDIKCSVTVDVKSADSVPALLIKAAEMMREEFNRGVLIADDNDRVEWSTLYKTENDIDMDKIADQLRR